MKALELHRDSLGAAIRARPAQPLVIVWIHDAERGNWGVLRDADGTGLINTMCLRSFCPDVIAIRTSTADRADSRRPRNTCPACETELAAGTPGGAMAIELVSMLDGVDLLDEDAITEPRVPTRDLRPSHRRVDPPAVWDGGSPGSDSAFDSLNDQRVPEEP